jgi:polyphosphate kinase
MVVRDEPEGLRRYVHIGTGNYNPKTARIYEDIGLLTANRSSARTSVGCSTTCPG